MQSLIRSKDKLHEAVVNLSSGKVEVNLRLGPNVHSNADGDEIIKVEKIALEDENVRAEIAKLQLPEGTVVISDPWIYGKLKLSNGRTASDKVQDLMGSMMDSSLTPNACSNAFFTSEIPTTLLKPIPITMLCQSASLQSSAPRP